MPTDTFLALVCGREVAEHGLPHTDSLAVVTRGHPWVDAQWLGQLVIYGLVHVGGLRAAFMLQALVTASTFALCARHALTRDAPAAAVLLCSIAGFGLGAGFFSLRPQMFSLLGFAAVLVLASQDASVPSKRVWWVIPILVLWANLHGVVVLGAAVVMLRAVMQSRSQPLRALSLFVLSALTPFCTPYALHLPRYFRDIAHIQDPERALPILEWNRVQWPEDWGFFAIFGVLLSLLIVVHVKKLSRPPPFEAVVLAVTGVLAWHASRHLQWFGLAVVAYAPLAVAAVPLIRSGRVLAMVASAMGVVGPLALGASLLRLARTKPSDIERNYPRDVIPVLAALTSEHPDWRLAASDHFADWALWYVPELRGRIEVDVRFELLDDAQARAMGTFMFAKPGWRSVYADANVVLVSRVSHPTLDQGMASYPGASVVWESPLARLYVR